MGNPLSRTLKDEVAVRASLAPVAGSASYQNGAWVDRTKFRSAVAAIAYTTSGGVTGGTIKVKVQDATSSGGAGSADFSTEQTLTIGAGPNETGIIEHDVNLAGARDFVRIAVDADPTGGTPVSIVSAVFVFGNPINRPAV